MRLKLLLLKKLLLLLKLSQRSFPNRIRASSVKDLSRWVRQNSCESRRPVRYLLIVHTHHLRRRSSSSSSSSASIKIRPSSAWKTRWHIQKQKWKNSSQQQPQTIFSNYKQIWFWEKFCITEFKKKKKKAERVGCGVIWVGGRWRKSFSFQAIGLILVIIREEGRNQFRERKRDRGRDEVSNWLWLLLNFCFFFFFPLCVTIYVYFFLFMEIIYVRVSTNYNRRMKWMVGSDG